MHIIILLIFIPLLLAAVWGIAVQLPFNLIAEGMAGESPGLVLTGIIVFITIWGGAYAILAH